MPRWIWLLICCVFPFHQGTAVCTLSDYWPFSLTNSYTCQLLFSSQCCITRCSWEPKYYFYIIGQCSSPVIVIQFRTKLHTVQHSIAQHSTAQHSTAQHSTAQHSTAQRSAAQRSTAQHSTAQHRTVQHSTGQCSAVQYSTVQCSTAQHSTGQCSAVQDSTAQHSAVQRSAVQYSTVLWMTITLPVTVPVLQLPTVPVTCMLLLM